MTYLPVFMCLYDMIPHACHYNNCMMDYLQQSNVQTNNNHKALRLKPAYIDTSVKADSTSPTSNSSSIDTSPTSTFPPHNSTLPLQTTHPRHHICQPKHLRGSTIAGLHLIRIGLVFMYITCFVTINIHVYLCIS